jgi:hypothetical protein
MGIIWFAVTSFLLHPVATVKDFKYARKNYDAEGRYVGPPGTGWRDGINPDGTRKDGKPTRY